MPLYQKIEDAGFSYAEVINELTEEVIRDAKIRFEEYKHKGVILCGEFMSGNWRVTDEVRKSVDIKFDVNEVTFRRFAEKKLDCSYQDYQTALRVYAITRFGYTFATIIKSIKILARFAETLQLPENPGEYSVLQDFLELLPGESAHRDRLDLEMLGATYQCASSGAMPRTLSSYWSYFSFGHYMTQFWSSASREEKLLFFPLWLWWTVTTIIPLRVTEFVLTPRLCIRNENGVFYLKLRRTILKRKNGSSQYSISEDYEICEYSIPGYVYTEIANYQAATAGVYESDIDILFCKSTQFHLGSIKMRNDRHYTRSNLAQLLDNFYDSVLAGRFGLKITDDNDNLYQNTIGKLRLGDTRHIALINLMVSGNSVVLCKELARHGDFESSSNYYSNIKSFVDCLVFHPFSQDYLNSKKRFEFVANSAQFVPVADGFCTSNRFAKGDFSICENAVSAGEVGVCRVCPYFYAKKSAADTSSVAENQLQTSCILLSMALKSIRDGDPALAPLPTIIEKLRTAEAEYLTASMLTRRLAEEEGIIYA